LLAPANSWLSPWGVVSTSIMIPLLAINGACTGGSSSGTISPPPLSSLSPPESSKYIKVKMIGIVNCFISSGYH